MHSPDGEHLFIVMNVIKIHIDLSISQTCNAWLAQSFLSAAQPVLQAKGPENVMELDIKRKIYSISLDL